MTDRILLLIAFILAAVFAFMLHVAVGKNDLIRHRSNANVRVGTKDRVLT